MAATLKHTPAAGLRKPAPLRSENRLLLPDASASPEEEMNSALLAQACMSM